MLIGFSLFIHNHYQYNFSVLFNSYFITEKTGVKILLILKHYSTHKIQQIKRMKWYLIKSTLRVVTCFLKKGPKWTTFRRGLYCFKTHSREPNHYTLNQDSHKSYIHQKRIENLLRGSSKTISWLKNKNILIHHNNLSISSQSSDQLNFSGIQHIVCKSFYKNARGIIEIPQIAIINNNREQDNYFVVTTEKHDKHFI